MRKVMKRALLFLDDVLLVAGGVCLTGAAYLQWGGAAALATAGVFLLGLAIVIAKAKGGVGH